ncbi:MAG: hypothetical protein K2N58_02750 [Treponemataceae bacterium]|nr:hypothetical protein [Treponemataceae bacterium]
MKKQCAILFVMALFVSICYAERNKYGYSVSAKLFNKDNIGIAVANKEIGFCFVSTEKRFAIDPVFAEKEGKNIKYFYTNAYSVEQLDKSNYKETNFTIPDNAIKTYISIDEIFPDIEAERIFNTVFFALGGNTGRGNWSAKGEIAREENAAGRKLRKVSFKDWQKQPTCYALLKSRIKYWKNYDNEVIGWLAEIVKYEDLAGYDDLMEYVEQL